MSDALDIGAEARRLIEQWITAGSAQLRTGKHVELDAGALMRLALDVHKQAPRRLKYIPPPSDFHLQRTRETEDGA
jgi:hypothetical protein